VIIVIIGIVSIIYAAYSMFTNHLLFFVAFFGVRHCKMKHNHFAFILSVIFIVDIICLLSSLIRVILYVALYGLCPVEVLVI